MFKDKGLWELPLVPFIYEHVYQLIAPNYVTELKIKDISLLGYSNDSGIIRELLINKSYEEYEIALFVASLENVNILVDVGANIGLYSVLGGKILKNKGQVYAFEPDPRNFELLSKNIKINELCNVNAYCKAVSNSCNTTRLFRDKCNFGNHSFSSENVPNLNDSLEVETITLDKFFLNNTSTIDVLKIDVQGAEMLVLEGATELLKKGYISKMFIEYWPQAINRVSPGKDLILYLKSMDFNINVIDEKNRVLIPLEKYNLDKSKNLSLNILCIKNR